MKLIALSTLFVFACAAPPESATPRDDAPTLDSNAAATPVDAGAPLATGEATPVNAMAETPRRKVLSDDQLALWNDPGFKRRFTESYIAETEVEPSISVNETETIFEVRELMAADQVDKALALLRKEGGPAASARLDFAVGNIYFEQENLDAAAGAYRQAVAKHAKFRRAWQNLGITLMRQDKQAEAAEALTKVIEYGGGDALTFGFLGFAHLKTGNPLAAETACRMATLLDPDTAEWRVGLIGSLFRQERFEEVVSMTSAMISETPDAPELWMNQAKAYIGLKQPLRAAENFEMVSSLGGATFESLSTLGLIYAQEGLFDLSTDSYVAALELDPEGDLEQPLMAARVMTEQAAFGDARRLLEAIEAGLVDGLQVETKTRVLKLRSRIAVAEGSDDEEAAVLEEIVAIDPLDGEALIYLGEHAERQGNQEKAIFYFEQAAGIEKFEADAKVKHAQLLVRAGHYTEALPLLRQAQAIEPRTSVEEYLDQIERIARKR